MLTLKEIAEAKMALAEGVLLPSVWTARAFDAADALLRILDAFDAMERERFSISVEGRGFTCVDKDGNAFTARFESPLLTLLAAADKMKGASDAKS